jgi:acid stress-induced BolA-like protein IbaG/YrbA
VDKATLEKLIATGIPGAQVDAVDLHGTGDHFEVTVVSDRFEGETLVKRHRLVYDAIGDAMRSEIHALMIRALSPDQFRDGLQKIG